MQSPTGVNGSKGQKVQQVPRQVQQVPQQPFVQPASVLDLGANRETM